MGAIKDYGMMLAGLLVALIVLMFLLNLAKKVPVVGGIAADAQNLATTGQL